MSKVAVEVVEISKRYNECVALDSLSLQFKKGEFVVLLGPSGSGKTTLLSILGGFTKPTSGTIRIAGSDVTQLPPARRPTVTVFQDYALFPHMTVQDNVKFGLEMRRVGKAEREKLASKALTVVGLEGLGGRRIHELSGGQRQRVALARAIVIEPEVLLLDEPLGALDVKIRRQMQDELHSLQRSLKATFIHVTHDQEEAMSIADTIVLLNKGRIEDVGPPERIYRRPASLFAATFMGDTNVVKGTIASVSNGTAIIETPFGNVAANGTGKKGAKVHLSIRPECIHVGNGSGETCAPLGNAQLDEFVFQGTHMRCQAKMKTSGEEKLTLRLPTDHELAEKSQVSLWVQSKDVMLINREAESD